MQAGFLDHLTATLAQIDSDGLMKREREIASPQSGTVTLADVSEEGGAG